MENKITKSKSVLIVLGNHNQSEELSYLKENFCGQVVDSIPDVYTDKRVYICGNLEEVNELDGFFYLIEDLSENYVQLLAHENCNVVTSGAVPVVINDSGVFIRKLFDGDDFFNRIESEHDFQELTESNKNSIALRKGVYITEVIREENAAKEEVLNFNLLRCSSNLTGPSENFRETDKTVINALNNIVKYSFEAPVKMNHVLAQIYLNKKKPDGVKEAKARIKAHSDKTKDMPEEGIIAFCTFYDQLDTKELLPSKTDRFDWCYKTTSGLTKLHFKLKSNVSDDSLKKEFTITLYPNSIFLIPLSTNRLYTHEIRPSTLNIERIPVRMGYVARCSNLNAVYKNNQTFIEENGALIKLEEMTEETMNSLRDSYYKENVTADTVAYDKVHFSMNSGDYKKPVL